ncbi:MAG: carboxypeptidase-like regulatory domain-containing protein [Planctomycetota bacterium]|jgi:hypothetical protein
MRRLLVATVVVLACLAGAYGLWRWQGWRIRAWRETLAEPGPGPPVWVGKTPGIGSRATVEGSVRGADGRALADADVAVLGVASTRTGADGGYRFEAVPCGRHYFDVRAEGYAPLRARAEVGRGERHAFVLQLLRPLFGRVVDQAGAPVAGVSLQARGEDGRLHAGETGRDGRFRLPDTGAGTWRLRALPPPPPDRWRGAAEWLVRGRDCPLTLRLVRRAPGRATLDVEVVARATGEPARPVTAVLWQVDPEPAPPVGTRPARCAPGRVTAADLGSGRWRLRVTTAAGHRAERTFTVRPEDTCVHLVLEAGAPGAIVGRVLLDGLPPDLRAQRLEVLVSPQDEGRSAQGPTRGRAPVEAGGRFRLADVRSGTPVRLYLYGKHVWGEQAVTVPPGGEVSVDLPARVAGELAFLSEAPCPVSAITYALNGGEVRRRGGLAGRRELVRLVLPPGPVRWRIRYFAPFGGDLRVAAGEATVTPRGTVRVPVRFEHGR